MDRYDHQIMVEKQLNFQEMHMVSVEPDEVLTTCSHSRLVQESEECFANLCNSKCDIRGQAARLR